MTHHHGVNAIVLPEVPLEDVDALIDTFVRGYVIHDVVPGLHKDKAHIATSDPASPMAYDAPISKTLERWDDLWRGFLGHELGPCIVGPVEADEEVIIAPVAAHLFGLGKEHCVDAPYLVAPFERDLDNSIDGLLGLCHGRACRPHY